MRTLKKCIAGLLMMSIIGLHLPNAAFCGGAGQFATKNNKPITWHKVRTMSTPEDIPVEKVQGGEKKRSNWLLLGVGAALVVGLVAAGGGGGGGGGGQVNPSSNTGNVTIEW
jgi:hypothetical protein